MTKIATFVNSFRKIFRTLPVLALACMALTGNVFAMNKPEIRSQDAGLAIYKSLLPKAESGDPEAQTTLGLMRLRGDAMPRELMTARLWLGRAAVQNHTPAQYYLGQLLLLDVFNANRDDLKTQLTEGLGWLRRASREQHQPSQLLYAQTILESQFENPFGHSKIEAMHHLNDCAETHIDCTVYALNRLDDGQVEAYCPSTEICEQKRRLLYNLANAEDANARYRLSNFEGEDHMFWLRRAARLNHPQASFELAESVLNNKVLLQHEDPSVLSLLNSAAQQGVVEAMYLLGTLLHQGKRFPVNKPLGLQWLHLAADHGFEPAKQSLAELQTPTSDDLAKSQIESAPPTKSTP